MNKVTFSDIQKDTGGKKGMRTSACLMVRKTRHGWLRGTRWKEQGRETLASIPQKGVSQDLITLFPGLGGYWHPQWGLKWPINRVKVRCEWPASVSVIFWSEVKWKYSFLTYIDCAFKPRGGIFTFSCLSFCLSSLQTCEVASYLLRMPIWRSLKKKGQLFII